MKEFRKRRDCYAVFFVIGIVLTLIFAMNLMLVAAFISGMGSFILFIILVRQHLLLRDANLIWDNPILTVSSSIIIKSEGKKWEAEKTIFSTFGILMGSKIYKWGSEGVHGVRLKSILIDRERIHLTFGDLKKTICVEMLHGMADKQAVLDVQKRLLYETGVSAMISGW
ncbi:MAG: hypothetical protein ACOX4H_06915 [Bacillota bacterium]|nr:hypothetical protein [Clostridia bacterium]